jgi:hypothetical protein
LRTRPGCVTPLQASMVASTIAQLGLTDGSPTPVGSLTIL